MIVRLLRLAGARRPGHRTLPGHRPRHAGQLAAHASARVGWIRRLCGDQALAATRRRPSLDASRAERFLEGRGDPGRSGGAQLPPSPPPPIRGWWCASGWASSGSSLSARSSTWPRSPRSATRSAACKASATASRSSATCCSPWCWPSSLHRLPLRAVRGAKTSSSARPWLPATRRPRPRHRRVSSPWPRPQPWPLPGPGQPGASGPGPRPGDKRPGGTRTGPGDHALDRRRSQRPRSASQAGPRPAATVTFGRAPRSTSTATPATSAGLAQRLHRGQHGLAGGGRVLDREHPPPGHVRALDPALRAVLLIFFRTTNASTGVPRAAAACIIAVATGSAPRVSPPAAS